MLGDYQNWIYDVVCATTVELRLRVFRIKYSRINCILFICIIIFLLSLLKIFVLATGCCSDALTNAVSKTKVQNYSVLFGGKIRESVMPC